MEKALDQVTEWLRSYPFKYQRKTTLKAGHHQMSLAKQIELPQQPSDGPISVRQGPQDRRPQNIFASPVPLHVCCCFLSVMSDMVELGVGTFPIDCNVMCLSRGNIQSH